MVITVRGHANVNAAIGARGYLVFEPQVEIVVLLPRAEPIVTFSMAHEATRFDRPVRCGGRANCVPTREVAAIEEADFFGIRSGRGSFVGTERAGNLPGQWQDNEIEKEFFGFVHPRPPFV